MVPLSLFALSNIVLTNKYLVPVSPEPMFIVAVFVYASPVGAGLIVVRVPPVNSVVLVDK